jgi:DNA polymerase I
MSDNKLIFGKNDTQRIVSCESQGGSTEIFIEEKDGTIRSEFKPNKYWLLASNPLDRSFTRLDGNLYYKWMKTYDNETDFKLDKKIYYKRDIYTISDSKEAAMVAFGFTYFKGMKIEDVSVLSFDIETNGLERNNDSRIFLISNTFRRNGVTTRKLFSYNEYENDGEMLDAWCKWVREVNPSVMLGHNIYGFDLNYMDHVASLHNTSLSLGRNGSSIKFSTYESDFRVDGAKSYKYNRAHIYGREIIDTMFIALKYDIGKNYESYRLKSIIAYEGLEVEGRQHYDAMTIKDNYNIPEEWEKIKAYAMFDADDSLALYDLMIPSFFYLSQSVPKPFQSIGYSASGSQINSFLVRSYLQDGHSIPKATEVTHVAGGISFGVPGVYRNVLKIDYAGLYPSIIRQYKVYDEYKDPKQHFLKMVEYFALQRLTNKKLAKETGDQYYKDLDQSGKVFVNSSYGLLATNGLNFNSVNKASFITGKARELLTYSIEWATSKKLDYWLQLFEEKTK